MKYDNIMYKMMSFLGRITRNDVIRMFGEEDGTSLWSMYKVRYHGNPWLWFMDALNEDMQNIVTFDALTYPIAGSPIDACFELDWWASCKANTIVSNLMEGIGYAVIEDEVLHDFPMKNGYYQTKITSVTIEPGSGEVVVHGKYNGENIKDYWGDNVSVVQQLKLYRAIKNSVKDED